ncbi:hypothetical protein [Endozoicomonas atrinae]|uniref:hypothetical protein n=1 Tax=Endozoicomonas atrinae TaxID=1333660 RepID=UPI001586B530|nr:hypothetical protein [Endozoicomonas atrinae]
MHKVKDYWVTAQVIDLAPSFCRACLANASSKVPAIIVSTNFCRHSHLQGLKERGVR